ncbi:DUF6045 family protein [Oscillospiraceae bacterium OttesenSCG-928-F05]|nr:DUF6045 family protein [Oscillospiraceae bacterium OttesenSCG-928-F05]
MFGIDSLFQSLLDYLYGEIGKGLSDFFVQMNSMGVDVLELPWIAALISFFSHFGWALFLAGVAVAIFDTAIEAQNGKASIRDTAINLIKGFMAVSLFTVVPVELFKFCVGLQGQLGRAVCTAFQIEAMSDIGTLASNILGTYVGVKTFTAFNILFIIMLGYSVIKVFFANIKRGGILIINIAVGSLYMLSVPRGYLDGFNGWCKQVAALCLTTVLQNTLLIAGLLTCSGHPLLGIGLMLSANEVPRIAERFGLDTSVKVNFMSSYYAISSMVNMAKGIAKVAAK